MKLKVKGDGRKLVKSEDVQLKVTQLMTWSQRAPETVHASLMGSGRWRDGTGLDRTRRDAEENTRREWPSSVRLSVS